MNTPPPDITLVQLIQEYEPLYGSLSALGRAIGVSPSRLSRLARGQGGTSLEVINCLRLALATNKSASFVLRAAGKGDIADLLEKLYGGPRVTVPDIDPEVTDLWARIRDDEMRAHLKGMMRLAAAATAPAPKRDEAVGPGTGSGRNRGSRRTPRGSAPRAHVDRKQ